MEMFILHLVLLALRWYHDGMTTGVAVKLRETLTQFSSRQKWLKCKGKKLLLVVYARI